MSFFSPFSACAGPAEAIQSKVRQTKDNTSLRLHEKKLEIPVYEGSLQEDPTCPTASNADLCTFALMNITSGLEIS
jgi:hypothetical protein